MKALFVINASDSVGVAAEPLEPGTVPVTGASGLKELVLTEPVEQGHKAAICDIPAGSRVMKYGVPIGIALKDIRAGEWVHLHNMKSAYDERSSHIDPVSGAAGDTRYE